MSDAGHSGQLTWRDATETLNASMNHGRLDADRFDNSVGALVRQLAPRGTGLHIYGEMVDLLAAEGDYRSAQALEELWNALAARETFTLLCGYSAAHFGDPRTADALSAVCRAHTCVRFNPRDVLASHLSNPPSAARRGVR